ncbi:MAG: hypothetical protein R3E97_19595 [Candidatus Eisenbacteria bacterium]
MQPLTVGLLLAALCSILATPFGIASAQEIDLRMRSELRDAGPEDALTGYPFELMIEAMEKANGDSWDGTRRTSPFPALPGLPPLVVSLDGPPDIQVILVSVEGEAVRYRSCGPNQQTCRVDVGLPESGAVLLVIDQDIQVDDLMGAAILLTDAEQWDDGTADRLEDVLDAWVPSDFPVERIVLEPDPIDLDLRHCMVACRPDLRRARERGAVSMETPEDLEQALDRILGEVGQ